jgi:N-acylneuraminate cytidylyltransferase
MIAWSIEAALATGVFERVVVSTDDEDIADVARGWGAEIPFQRPRELADDHAGTTEVIGHATRWAIDIGWRPTAVCCIYATAPFVAVDDIRRGLATLDTGAWSYVFSAAEFAAPVFRAFRQRPDGGVEMLFPENFAARSQDLPKVLHDAGQFYWGLPSVWLDGKRIFAAHSTPVVIPRWRVQDIDSEDDWVRAEAMATYLMARDRA